MKQQPHVERGVLENQNQEIPPEQVEVIEAAEAQEVEEGVEIAVTRNGSYYKSPRKALNREVGS